MTETQQPLEEVPELTLEYLEDHLIRLEDKVDKLGELVDWLCVNMDGLFKFINQMGNSGGGIRGLLKAASNMNSTPAETTDLPVNDEDKGA